jgi:hypothetical protein
MRNYEKKEPIKITIEGGLSPDRSIQLTLNPYATLEEWIETFKVILLHQTFSEDTIKELFDMSETITDSDECCGVCECPTDKPRSEWNEF